MMNGHKEKQKQKQKRDQEQEQKSDRRDGIHALSSSGGGNGSRKYAFPSKNEQAPPSVG